MLAWIGQVVTLQTRRVVSVYLASLADAAPLPRCPGVSTRAMRSALRMMCRIAQNDGTMRYGLRASKLAQLCEYSVATIHRAERYLIEHGYIERVRKGGGRLSTHWRIVVDKLAPADSQAARTVPAARACKRSRETTASTASLATAELLSAVLACCHDDLCRTRRRRRHLQRRNAPVSAVSATPRPSLAHRPLCGPVTGRQKSRTLHVFEHGLIVLRDSHVQSSDEAASKAP